MKKAEAAKDLWQLRWEYLKRSDNYFRYCEVVSDSDFIPDDDLLWSYLRANYQIFGDLYKDSFEDWWKTERRYSVKDEYLSHLRIDNKDVADYSLLIAEDMNDFRERFKNPPSLDEFIRAFSDHLKNVRWLYLRVNVLGVNDSEISKQVHAVIKKKKRSPSIKEHIRALSLYDDPQTVRDELKMYLEIYDLKKSGKSIRQIIENIGTKAEKAHSKDNDVQRVFKRYIQKAKKIIQNVERLNFPGKY